MRVKVNRRADRGPGDNNEPRHRQVPQQSRAGLSPATNSLQQPRNVRESVALTGEEREEQISQRFLVLHTQMQEQLAQMQQMMQTMLKLKRREYR